MDKKLRIKLILAVIIGIVIGFIIGTIFGMNIMLQKVINIARGFIDIDEELIKAAVWKYEHSVAQCFPPLT